jgi:dTDP-4-amino-4,6-dideoxygalactose transaminase
MAVPLMNVRAQYESLIPEITKRFAEIVDSSSFVLGAHVKAFEAEAAAYLGTKHAIGVANGTDALVIVLRALGIGPGDEVICPPYTFYATPESIAAVGATPVFADVDEQTFNLDLDEVRSRITGRTKAIMPVHLFGQPADMDELNALAKEHSLAVVEDAAQAWGATYKGARVGSLGDAATFSFYPTKNLGGFGDGGLIATNSDELAELARMLRFHGSKDKKTFTHVGFNSRLDELQAAVLRLELEHIDEWNGKREQVAAWYAEAGLGDLVDLPAVGDGRSHIYHLYVVGCRGNRDAIQAACKEAGVSTSVYYGDPLHLQPVFEHLGGAPGDMPVTERFGRENLAIPMFPLMTREQVEEVVAAVRSAVPAGVA